MKSHYVITWLLFFYHVHIVKMECVGFYHSHLYVFAEDNYVSNLGNVVLWSFLTLFYHYDLLALMWYPSVPFIFSILLQILLCWCFPWVVCFISIVSLFVLLHNLLCWFSAHHTGSCIKECDQTKIIESLVNANLNFLHENI